MSTKKILLPAAIALAFGAGSANAFLIDFNGDGVGAKQIAGFDPAPGNLISRCAATGSGCVTDVNGKLNLPASGDGTFTLETFGHAALNSASFSDSGGNGVNFFLPGEWTLVFGFTETAVISGSTTTAFLSGPAPGTKNFFELYYDATGNSNMLGGTGFNDGKKILSGTLNGFDPLDPTFGRADFKVTNLGDPLDKFNADNYPGKTSVATNGNIQLKLTPTFQDPNFFIDSISGLILQATSQLNLPFIGTNPSGCFVSAPGGGAPSLGGAGASSGAGGQPGCGDTIGAVNGVSGPNIIFQNDANVSLISPIPEPTTLALLGGSLLAAGASRRFRKKA